MRPSLRLVAGLLALALPVAAPVRAEGSPPEALASGWTRADDAARDTLLAKALEVPSRGAIDAIGRAARAALGVRKEAARLKRAFDEPRKPAEGETPDPAVAAKERAQAKDLGAQIAREDAGLARLAAGLGRALDALPDAEAAEVVRELLKRSPDAGLPGTRAFTGSALGASRLLRTVVVLLDAAADARKEAAKAGSQREEPARKLEEVVRKLNDAVERYLKAQRAKGDTSGLVPVGLVGTLPAQKDELQGIVNRLGDVIDAASDRRRAARDGLAGILGGLVPAEAEKGIDLVEHKMLRSDDPEERTFGLATLAATVSPRAFAILAKAVDARDPRDACAAIDALAGRGEPEVIALLSRRLADDAGDWRVRSAAAAALAASGRAVAVAPLVDALDGASGRLIDDLRDALVRLTGERYPGVHSPWKAWWELAQPTFRGPKDPVPPGSPPAGNGPAGAPGAGPAAAPAADGFTFYGITSHSTRTLFVLDYSGSMNWPGSERDAKVMKVDVLRREMRTSLAGLPDGATFGIVAFSTDVRPFRKEPTIRSVKTATDARIWIEKAQADGGTNIGDALEEAFRMAGAGLAKDKPQAPVYDTIFFMTDGRPSVGRIQEPRQILAAVRRWNEGRRVRVHVVGMGGHGKPGPDGKPVPKGPKNGPEDDLDEDFLRDLAAENGGECVLR